jgi:hypothetical protein
MFAAHTAWVFYVSQIHILWRVIVIEETESYSTREYQIVQLLSHVSVIVKKSHVSVFVSKIQL